LNRLEGGNGYVCQHVLRAVLNVVLDVNACGYQISDQAGRIAEKMAASATRRAH
jgi:serine/threonine-protein kinase